MERTTQKTPKSISGKASDRLGKQSSKHHRQRRADGSIRAIADQKAFHFTDRAQHFPYSQVEKTLYSTSELAEYAFIVSRIACLEKGLHRGDTITRDFIDYFILNCATHWVSSIRHFIRFILDLQYLAFLLQVLSSAMYMYFIKDYGTYYC